MMNIIRLIMRRKQIERLEVSLGSLIYAPHIFIQRGDAVWGLQHPLLCRRDGIANCPVHNSLARLDGVLADKDGDYIVSVDPDTGKPRLGDRWFGGDPATLVMHDYKELYG